MQRLLEICESFATDHCLKFNIQKVNQLVLGRGDPFTVKRQLSPSMERVCLKYMMSLKIIGCSERNNWCGGRAVSEILLFIILNCRGCQRCGS